MTLPLATHGYLVDDNASSLLATTGQGTFDPPPKPPCGHAVLENPPPPPPIGKAVVVP
jgi:hypothetical protein